MVSFYIYVFDTDFLMHYFCKFVILSYFFEIHFALFCKVNQIMPVFYISFFIAILNFFVNVGSKVLKYSCITWSVQIMSSIVDQTLMTHVGNH